MPCDITNSGAATPPLRAKFMMIAPILVALFTVPLRAQQLAPHFTDDHAGQGQTAYEQDCVQRPAQ